MSIPRWISLLPEPGLEGVLRGAVGAESVIVATIATAVTGRASRRVRLLMRRLPRSGEVPHSCFSKVLRLSPPATSGGTIPPEVAMNACLGLMISLLLLPAPAATGWELTRKAMADLRAIGTVMESYAVDHNAYPETTGLDPVEELAGRVEPVYIKKLPRTDPWGKPYYVWSTGKQYLVVSGGADRTLD